MLKTSKYQLKNIKELWNLKKNINKKTLYSANIIITKLKLSNKEVNPKLIRLLFISRKQEYLV